MRKFTTYRARDRGGAASVPRRRRDVDYMLSSGRPRIFVGWYLLDRHEKGIASLGVATLAELRRPQPLSGSTCTLCRFGNTPWRFCVVLWNAGCFNRNSTESISFFPSLWDCFDKYQLNP